MCDPVSITMAVVAIAGAAYSADQQREAGKANAAIAENNAILADQSAKTASAMGDREAEQAAWRNRAILGQQRAAFAANGFDAQIGTPLELMGETAMFGEIDQQTIRMNAANDAWGFKAEATNYRNASKQARWSGNSQATGTILGGLGSAATIGMGAYAGSGTNGRVNKKTTGTVNSGSSYGGYT